MNTQHSLPSSSAPGSAPEEFPSQCPSVHPQFIGCVANVEASASCVRKRGGERCRGGGDTGIRVHGLGFGFQGSGHVSCVSGSQEPVADTYSLKPKPSTLTHKL